MARPARRHRVRAVRHTCKGVGSGCIGGHRGRRRSGQLHRGSVAPSSTNRPTDRERLKAPRKGRNGDIASIHDDVLACWSKNISIIAVIV